MSSYRVTFRSVIERSRATAIEATSQDELMRQFHSLANLALALADKLEPHTAGIQGLKSNGERHAEH